ncbi:MAG TPA: hypothetical protein V6C63_16910 [Allocoleopsis sp.]
MSQRLHWIVPAPPPDAEIFAVYQATHEFYREAQYREALEAYCEWYEETATAHRRELEKMRGDVNIFGWFSRRDR